MKINRITSLLGSGLLLASCATETRVVLDRDMFRAGESRRYVIATNEPIMIGFEADVPLEIHDRYDVLPSEVGDSGWPISIRRLDSANGTTSISSIYGIGTNFSPVDDKVEIEVTNGIDTPVTIEVYTESL